LEEYDFNNMPGIVASIIRVNDGKWIGVAIETTDDSLVACTTPMDSKGIADSLIRKSLQRLQLSRRFLMEASTKTTTSIAQRLQRLFHGKGESYDLGEISQNGWSPARMRIGRHLLEVPSGKVITYGGLAKRAQSSPRGVGSVMASNPVPLAIPCHRVILADGRLGKFGRSTSGTIIKAAILRAEGVPFLDAESVEQIAIVD
jgi:methylated-DNA-[protein]-cysteine S-methyltransferase